MALMKAQHSAPVVQQVVTLKSTGVTGLTIGLMILTGCAEVPSEQLEQVWNRFSAEGPETISHKYYYYLEFGKPGFVSSCKQYPCRRKIDVAGSVYSKQFMSSTS